MDPDVRFRTLPLPDEPQEQAFRQVLEELAGAVRDFDSDEPEQDLLTQARAAGRNVVRAWEALPSESPYRDVVGDAALLLHRLAEAAWASDAVVARDLEEVRADLVLLEARRQVMKIVASVVARDGLRRVADTVRISVGHMSELSNGRGGLPRGRTARAIDEVAGTAIEDLVRAARAEADEIRQAARKRERKATASGSRPRPSTSDTMTRINLALSEDPELLALVGKLLDTPGQARRALLDLLASLGQRAPNPTASPAPSVALPVAPWAHGL